MKVLLTCLLLLTFASCASKKDERDIEEKAQASTVSDSKTLGSKIEELLNSSKTLKVSQKNELRKIFAENKMKADELTEKSYQFRSVLIKELLSGNANENRIKILKKDIKKVESEKLKNTFDTVDKISNLTTNHDVHEDVMNHLIQTERVTP